MIPSLTAVALRGLAHSGWSVLHDAFRFESGSRNALTGSLGTPSAGPEIISNPLGSLAATITAPFVQWNQAHFATAFARTRYDEAVLRFQKALWQALSDVDNGLSARAQLAEEGAAVALP